MWAVRGSAIPLSVFIVLAATCGCSPSTKPASGPSGVGCFGLPADFSGRLDPREEAKVPAGLRGAFYIESVQEITSADLKSRLDGQEKVAEEAVHGIRYVALKDYRCVDFGKGVSGMMIVIERYRVLDQ
jgi:hypothetical protein